jgi:hypothetical protein
MATMAFSIDEEWLKLRERDLLENPKKKLAGSGNRIALLAVRD